MAHIKSALKKAELSKINNERNKAVKSYLKSSVKKAQKTLTPEDVQEACSTIDKAASKNVIHTNAASRYKASIMKAAAAKK
jgi:small subunit ribosomal protein S20